MIAPSDHPRVLRLEGDCTMTSAVELKNALVQALAEQTEPAQEHANGETVCVDLAGAGEIDITTLQLLWAAERAARRRNRNFVSRVSDAFRALARDAGFERFPGEPEADEQQQAKG